MGRNKVLFRSLSETEIVEEMNWVGIDFGAKLAGTTCVALVNRGKIFIEQSEKRKDADAWLQDIIRDLNPSFIFIDAPLSLPPAFTVSGSTEFFYRAADRELRAMSPMFLGGLTARAMRLKKIWEGESRQVFETYPAAIARHLNLMDYKKDKTKLIKQFRKTLRVVEMTIAESPTNWHQIDSLLAWYAGHRFVNGIAQRVGDSSGYIYL